MKRYMDLSNLNYFEALASQTRLHIIRLLAERDRNIKELAEALDISSSIMTKHVRKLESAGIIATRNQSRDGSRQKVCTLLNTVAEVRTPPGDVRQESGWSLRETAVPVGQYSDIEARPPCGLADGSRFLGCPDEPAGLLAPERMAAQMLWIGGGYVEYLIPRYPDEKRLAAVEIAGEFAAGTPDGQASGVVVRLGGERLCSFTTPPGWGGAPATPRREDCRGGILIVIRIDEQGLSVNGERRSPLTVGALDARRDRWVLRFETEGSLAIFGGEHSGYGRDILFRAYYSRLN